MQKEGFATGEQWPQIEQTNHIFDFFFLSRNIIFLSFCNLTILFLETLIKICKCRQIEQIVHSKNGGKVISEESSRRRNSSELIKTWFVNSIAEGHHRLFRLLLHVDRVSCSLGEQIEKDKRDCRYIFPSPYSGRSSF